MKELCYRIDVLPDLTLNKYSSLDGNGVDGVLDKHLAFLRQWNRKGILADVSFHLFYFYFKESEKGNKLEVFFVVRGEEESLKNVPEMIKSSPLSPYFTFSDFCKGEKDKKLIKNLLTIEKIIEEKGVTEHNFSVCSSLIKKEVFIKSTINNISSNAGYYTIPQWEINDSGRLFNMTKLMEAIDKTVLYRVDLYPVEKNTALREDLRTPMSILRERQYGRSGNSTQRDFEAENVLKEYEDMLNNIDISPHFIANLFVFGNDKEDTTVILDAAGAEALKKGSYSIATYNGNFNAKAFLKNSNSAMEFRELIDRKSKIGIQRGTLGLTICNEEAKNYHMKYLPTLFTLEEIGPFFRFPTLYEGEVVQKRKETSPKAIGAEEGLFLGKDENGYEVYFPLENLAKHAFIAGVPGSGKTNTMHHITSTLWKEHGIPFLVLEPAKQEYRALANSEDMKELYIFSPNADMSFPLHINPFEFPRGLMVAEHIRRLVSVFEGAFPLDNPMPFLLDTAIEAVYRQLGWTPETVYTDKTKLKFPTMSMLYTRLEDELKSTQYSEEIRGNLESALKVRIGSLLRREMGDVFDVPSSTIAPEEWLKIPAVIELESMGTGPANFLTLILCSLIRETLKVNPHHDKKYARHIIFIEEAHNLIGPESEEANGADANPKQAATAFVVKMLAEVRALKEGIIIADQLPTVMAQEVIKNTGLKLGLRITSADDRSLLGSTMAANELQMEEMATFNVGEALISYEGLMRPFKIRINEWGGEIKDQGKKKQMVTSKSDVDLKELLKNRESYRKTCERSFIIETSQFARDYQELSTIIDDKIEYMKIINDKEVEILRREKRVFQLSKELTQKPNWEGQEEEVTKLQNMADYVNQLKYELDTKYKTSPQYTNVYNTILECIVLAKKIQDRKKHWNKIGINDFKTINALIEAKEQLNSIQVMVKGINDIQKTILRQVQQLFIHSRLQLPNADKIEKEILAAVKIFKADNILRG